MGDLLTTGSVLAAEAVLGASPYLLLRSFSSLRRGRRPLLKKVPSRRTRGLIGARWRAISACPASLRTATVSTASG